MQPARVAMQDDDEGAAIEAHGVEIALADGLPSASLSSLSSAGESGAWNTALPRLGLSLRYAAISFDLVPEKWTP